MLKIVFTFVSIVILATSAQQFPIHLMKSGSAAGTVDGLPAIMGCSDAVIPIAFDFDYVTGNTRSNMSCSNRYSMASFVSCSKENSVMANEVCNNGACACEQRVIDPNFCPATLPILTTNFTYIGTDNFNGQRALVWGVVNAGYAEVKLFVNQAQSAVLGFEIMIETPSTSIKASQKIVVTFSLWINQEPDPSVFNIPANCKKSSVSVANSRRSVGRTSPVNMFVRMTGLAL